MGHSWATSAKTRGLWLICSHAAGITLTGRHAPSRAHRCWARPRVALFTEPASGAGYTTRTKAPPRMLDQPQKILNKSEFFCCMGNRVTYFAHHASKMLRRIAASLPGALKCEQSQLLIEGQQRSTGLQWGHGVILTI